MPSNGSKRPIGYVVTQHFCLDCAPEGLRDYYEPMREGEDHGVPYSCDMCGADMVPAAALPSCGCVCHVGIDGDWWAHACACATCPGREGVIAAAALPGNEKGC